MFIFPIAYYMKYINTYLRFPVVIQKLSTISTSYDEGKTIPVVLNSLTKCLISILKVNPQLTLIIAVIVVTV